MIDAGGSLRHFWQPALSHCAQTKTLAGAAVPLCLPPAALPLLLPFLPTAPLGIGTGDVGLGQALATTKVLTETDLAHTHMSDEDA